ncbi:MAG: DUF4012 domain-containing protein [Actinomycetota bacterium]
MGSDIVTLVVLGGVMVFASSLTSTRVLLLAAVTLAALAGAPLGATIAVLVVGLAAAIRGRATGHRVWGAAAGAAFVQTLSAMPAGRSELNVALSFAVACLLGRTAWSALGGSRRERARYLSVRVGALVGLALAGFGLAGALALDDFLEGVRKAEAGLDAARDGESDRAADLLDDSSRSLAAAHDALDQWWARPALLLPVVGQHARALTSVAALGTDLTDAAATAARSARVDDLQVTDGKVDLAHVRSMAAPLASVRTAIDGAEEALSAVESRWLLPPVAGRLGALQRTVASAADEAESAAQAVAVLPDLLGGEGPRRYFVAFGTPAETRELGGFMGAYATLVADDGELSLEVTGRVRDINQSMRGRKLTDRAAFPAHFLAFQPQRFWQNITATADFPTLAEAVRQMWSADAGRVDGVLYMDPQTLADMLDLTGPIRVPDHDEPLTSDTAAPFLLRDQYIEFPDDDRHDFLVDAAETVFDELTTGDLPRPGAIVHTLAPAVRERRLLLHSFHSAEQSLFERFNLDGAMPPVRGDFLSVRASNRGLSKIDAMMQRTIDYSVAVDPGSDRVRATLTVSIENDAPSTGLPDPVIGNRVGKPTGTNSTTVSVYTPLELVDVTQGGRSVGRGAFRAHGRNRYTAQVDVPAGRTIEITFQLEGDLDLSDGYRLDVVPQPLVNPDLLRVTVDGPAGWQRSGEDAPTVELREVERFEVYGPSRSR